MPRQSLGPRLVHRKDKPNLYVRFIEPETGKQKDVSTGTRESEEAQEVLEEFLKDRRLSRSTRALPPYRVTIAELLDEYHSELVEEGRGERLYSSMQHLLEFWKDACVDAIKPRAVKAYIRQSVRSDDNPEGRSRSTVRRELSDLRAAVNSAIREHRVQPIVFPELPQEGKPRTRWLKRDEFDALYAEAANEYRSADPLQLFLMIGYYTGARRGAIMDLRWSDVDFEKNVIDFTIPDRGELIVDHKPRAITPMAPPLRKYLFARFEAYEDVPEYVFHQKKDQTRRVRSIAKGFRATAKRCGLNDVTPHTLRHTRVTELRNMGMQSHQVKAFLAMSAEMQDRVYVHSDCEDLQKMVLEIA